MTTIDQRLAKPQAVSDLAELGDKLLVAQAALSSLSEGQCRVSAGDLGGGPVCRIGMRPVGYYCWNSKGNVCLGVSYHV